jgi:hypothetical protein
MNIKQFLKPDWKKIVIMIGIFFFLIFISPCRTKGWEFVSGWRTCGSVNLFWEIFFIPKAVVFDYDILYLGFLNVERNRILIYFINLISSYFLSCLIIWISDKVKKKP